MIVYSSKQYLVLIPNTMVLEKDGNYFYIEKSLYDNLILLNHSYSTERISELIGKDNNIDIINWLIPQLPHPIDSLAPFLGLINKELTEDLELCIGSLHELFCTGLNPYGFIKLPIEARRGIEFGRTGSVYPDMWSSIMTQYVEFETIEEMLLNINKFNSIQYPTVLQPMAFGGQVPAMNMPYMNNTMNSAVESTEEEDIGEEFQSLDNGTFVFDDDLPEIDEDSFTFEPKGYVDTSSDYTNDEDATSEVDDEVAALQKILMGGGV